MNNIFRTTAPVLSNGEYAPSQCDASGNLKTTGDFRINQNGQIPAGAGIAVDNANPSALYVYSLGHVYNGTNWDRARGDTTGTYTVAKAATSGGLTSARVVAGTTGVIKASAGQVFALNTYNVNAGVRYLHLYNKATAPTLSTDTPIITIPILGASVRDMNIGGDIGREFTLGIAWAYTTDNVAIPVTAGTTAELHFSIGYK